MHAIADIQLLRPAEVARLLGAGKTKVYALIASGEIASVRVGGSRRVLVSALAAYIERLRTALADHDHGGVG